MVMRKMIPPTGDTDAVPQKLPSASGGVAVEELREYVASLVNRLGRLAFPK